MPGAHALARAHQARRTPLGIILLGQPYLLASIKCMVRLEPCTLLMLHLCTLTCEPAMLYVCARAGHCEVCPVLQVLLLVDNYFRSPGEGAAPREMTCWPASELSWIATVACELCAVG